MSEAYKIIAAILVLVVFSVVTWFRSTFGLDWTTSLWVVVAHAIFAGTIWLAVSIGLEIIPGLLPVAIVGYLACWRPALEYWATSGMQDFGFLGKDMAYVPWYGNNWIQLGIALAIIIFGYLFINFSRRY